MSEPLDEAVEESWIPAIFRRQGITRTNALLLWEFANLRSEITTLTEKIEGEL